ncbi:hypothetical protein AB0F81_33630 [Actinoplanes sp. NPDC024001]|uniref:hypothetical protein n=1 Tax=Actinoplanes sp. NPDC024001 TaxID=3154598 RepID=UPI0033EC9931
MSDIDDPPTLRIGGWIPPYVPQEPSRPESPRLEAVETRRARRARERERVAGRHRSSRVTLLMYASAHLLMVLAYAVAALLTFCSDGRKTQTADRPPAHEMDSR